MLQIGGVQAAVQLKGIDPAREVQVTELGTSMLEGSPNALAPLPAGEERQGADPILLGADLAEQLRVRVGEHVELMVPTGTLSPFGVMARLRPFIVSGIFKLGFHEFDANYALVPLDVAQSLFNEPAPRVIQLRVADIDAAPAIAAEIQDTLGITYTAEDWTVLNASLYEALRLEKMAIGLTIGLIVMVAALNIVASLVLLVMEKSRDIGILRTMGASAGAIRTIFMLQGVIIGAVGTTVGALLGVIVSIVCDRYQLFSLPGDVYQITHLRFRVEVLDVLMIVVAAMIVCLLATIYPSRQASKLDPAEALRYQ
jgi:lipoprotein-releasing system permease protein